MNKNILVWVIGVVSVLSLVFSLSSGTVTEVQKIVGVTAGDDFFNNISFYDDIVLGGSVFATSSQGTATYTAATLAKTSLIQHTAGGALTVTLPASSTITWIPKAGDKKLMFINPITTNITLAAGTGTDLNSASSTKAMMAGGLTSIEFVRKSNTDIEVMMTSGL